jgi:hypothetical protein
VPAAVTGCADDGPAGVPRAVATRTLTGAVATLGAQRPIGTVGATGTLSTALLACAPWPIGTTALVGPSALRRTTLAGPALPGTIAAARTVAASGLVGPGRAVRTIAAGGVARPAATALLTTRAIRLVPSRSIRRAVVVVGHARSFLWVRK